jgi:hypothetical protein
LKELFWEEKVELRAGLLTGLLIAFLFFFLVSMRKVRSTCGFIVGAAHPTRPLLN